MAFKSEPDFERSLITFLFDKGWEHEVLKNKTEEELIQNWADILYQNNRGIDELGNYPLIEGEMWQIISQVNQLKTPLRLNGFINGKSVSIVRDNPKDVAHLGKTVSLKIYDRLQIAAGSSRYQIAEQPKFKTANPLTSDRRGDFMLLINGMPVIHVELKKSGVPAMQAANQVKKYAAEGIFSKGIFSLVQVFVAMNPEETLYFANPGDADNFRPDFYFHWADFNNQPINVQKSDDIRSPKSVISVHQKTVISVHQKRTTSVHQKRTTSVHQNRTTSVHQNRMVSICSQIHQDGCGETYYEIGHYIIEDEQQGKAAV